MTASQGLEGFRSWLSAFDPTETDPAVLLVRFIKGLSSSGIPISRASLWLPTAHPELWGTQVIWTARTGAETIRRDHNVTATDTYLNTPGQEIYEKRRTLRWNLEGRPEELPYPMLREFRAGGATDYVMVPFQTDQWQEQPWIALATSRPGGFEENEISEFESACVQLAWKMRWAMSKRAMRDLLHVYLGPNAAEQVLKGQFRRGRSTPIPAVVWFCDLRGFTSLGASIPAEELVRVLDRYFECVSAPIEENGGEVLKFIGDAVLAVFPCHPNPADAANRALVAAQAALASLEKLSPAPPARAAPLRMGIALHVGEVRYGNVGGRSRLDFTVIGPAVNIASRVEGLCKKLDAPLLLTQAYVDARGSQSGLAALGSHTLRGVPEPQTVYTVTGGRYASE